MYVEVRSGSELFDSLEVGICVWTVAVFLVLCKGSFSLLLLTTERLRYTSHLDGLDTTGLTRSEGAWNFTDRLWKKHGLARERI